MRFDIGEWKFLRAGRFEIFLNGEPIRLVFAADENEGWIKRFKPGRDGRPYLNEAGGAAVTEILRGRVTIVDHGMNASDLWTSFKAYLDDLMLRQHAAWRV